jgi:hypothetical protein
MKKLATALSTTAVAGTMVLAAGAFTPASAGNPPCAAYPPGSAYTATLTPDSQSVTKGTTITASVRLHRGDTNCPNQVVYFQFAKKGQSFHAYRTRKTNANGVATQTYGINEMLTLRVVWNPTPHTTVQSNHPVFTLK